MTAKRTVTVVLEITNDALATQPKSDIALWIEVGLLHTKNRDVEALDVDATVYEGDWMAPALQMMTDENVAPASSRLPREFTFDQCRAIEASLASGAKVFWPSGVNESGSIIFTPDQLAAHMEQHLAAYRKQLEESDTYLRDIRAEKLDGSEAELGHLLETNLATLRNIPRDPDMPAYVRSNRL